jgi:hypothetical protein
MEIGISPERLGGTDCPGKRKHPRPAGWKRLVLALLPGPAAYRPERHYMRGPGPKWRERHGVSVWAHDPSNSA